MVGVLQSVKDQWFDDDDDDVSPQYGAQCKMPSRDPDDEEKKKSKFKGQNSRDNLEEYPRTLKSRLKGRQKESFQRRLEDEKLPGQQFNSKETIQRIFEEVLRDVKP